MRKPMLLCLLAALAACSTSHNDRSVAARLRLEPGQVAALRQKFDFSHTDLLEMHPAALRKSISKLALPHFDRPFEAASWRVSRLVDEHGQIPPNAQMDARRAAALTNLTDGVHGGLDSSRWVELGPGNIGGRIRSILIHPTNHDTMFVGSVSGGIWKTTDGGQSFARVDDQMGNLAVTSMIFANNDPNTIYAATGEGFTAGGTNQIAYLRGAGVFKSTDGGTTWAQLASTATPDFYYTNRIAMSPRNANVLIAATNTGLLRSTDGGATWTRTLIGKCFDVVFANSTTSASRVVACAQIQNGTNFHTTIVTSSTDGHSWQAVQASDPVYASGGGRRMELVASKSPAANGTFYCLRNDINYSTRAEKTTLLRSDNYGQSWSVVSDSTNILRNQGQYDNALWIAPDNDSNPANDVLIAGGIDIWRSTNGGSSWTKISEWTEWYRGRSAHADQHIAVKHPTSNVMFFGNDGGLFKTDDYMTVTETSGWINMNNNLGITQFYGGSHQVQTGYVFGGTQDNGTLRYTEQAGPNDWHSPIGGDGGFSAADQVDSRYSYGEEPFANMHRSSDSGNTAQHISGRYWNGSALVWKPAPYSIDDVRTFQAEFISPFRLDPSNQERLLVGCRRLWRTNDARTPATSNPPAGPSWQVIKAAAPSGKNISAIAIDPVDSNVVFVGHAASGGQGGEIYRSTNATSASPTWTRVDTAGMPSRYCTSLRIDPRNRSRVFATFGGYVSGNLWESTDSGATWSVVAAPPLPLFDIAVHPARSRWLYLATAIGLYVSEDGGANWVFDAGPANVAIDECFMSQGSLYLITHGRGIFRQSPTRARVDRIGLGCRGPNGQTDLYPEAGELPVIGESYSYEIRPVPFTASMFALMGFSRTSWHRFTLPLDLTPFGFQGCTIYTDVVTSTPLVATGISADWTIAVPNDQSLLGFETFQQVLVMTPGWNGAGGVLSHAWRALIGGHE